MILEYIFPLQISTHRGKVVTYTQTDPIQVGDGMEWSQQIYIYFGHMQ